MNNVYIDVTSSQMKNGKFGFRHTIKITPEINDSYFNSIKDNDNKINLTIKYKMIESDPNNKPLRGKLRGNSESEEYILDLSNRGIKNSEDLIKLLNKEALTAADLFDFKEKRDAEKIKIL